MQVALDLGIDFNSIRTNTGSTARRVQCVHCKGITDTLRLTIQVLPLRPVAAGARSYSGAMGLQGVNLMRKTGLCAKARGAVPMTINTDMTCGWRRSRKCGESKRFRLGGRWRAMPIFPAAPMSLSPCATVIFRRNTIR